MYKSLNVCVGSMNTKQHECVMFIYMKCRFMILCMYMLNCGDNSTMWYRWMRCVERSVCVNIYMYSLDA